MDYIHNLPPELLLLVADGLDLADKSRLHRTSSHLYSVLDPFFSGKLLSRFLDAHKNMLCLSPDFTTTLDSLLNRGANPFRCRREAEGVADIAPWFSNSGQTALHLAARAGAVDACRALLSSSVAAPLCGVRDSMGRTALHYAVRGGHCEIVRMLLRRPATDVDINAVDLCKWSVLHYAALSGNENVVDLLFTLRNDACNELLSAQDWHHETPLYHVSNAAVARTLLKAGADPNFRSEHRPSVLFIVRYYWRVGPGPERPSSLLEYKLADRDEVVAVLEQAGAQIFRTARKIHHVPSEPREI